MPESAEPDESAPAPAETPENPLSADFLATVSHGPGVYQMLGRRELLYVGKARDLRKRLAQYAHYSGPSWSKTAVMLGHVRRVETILTTTEKEALILEAALIKRHRPRSNVILRDDKKKAACHNHRPIHSPRSFGFVMHLLYGLFFLLLTIALALAYAAAAFLLLFLVLAFWPVDSQRAWCLSRLKTFFWSRRALYLALALVSFHCCLYLKARVEWMGRDNGNLAAKEYWVAGQGVFAWRALWMHLGGHPETWIVRPFVRVQEWIYQLGYPLLPEGDGERGVWTDMWLVYPYSRNMLLPKDNHDERTSAATTALLERAWEALELQATGSYADRKMREQYYRNFSRAAFYYDVHKYALNGRSFMSATLHALNTKLIERDRTLRQWLQWLPEQWATSGEMKDFVQKHPKIEATRQLAILMDSAMLLHSDILTVNFSCEHPDVQEYITARTDFIGDGVHAAAWQRMHQANQAENMYNLAVNTIKNRFIRYVLKRFCGREVPGKEMTLLSTRKTWTEQDEMEQFLYSGYFEELTILDTMYPDIPYGKGGAFSAEHTTKEYRQKEQKIREHTESILKSRLSNQANERR